MRAATDLQSARQSTLHRTERMGQARQQAFPEDYWYQCHLVSTFSIDAWVGLIFRSLMLYMIGFGCRQEASALQVGPLAPGEGVTDAQVLQQDRYMMRAWVELNMFLVGYVKLNGELLGLPRVGLIRIELRPLPEQDSILELTGLGPDIDDYTLARYLPSELVLTTLLRQS